MDGIKKILVTGGTGFVGKFLTRALLEAGASVRVTGQEPDPGLERLGAEWLPMADLNMDVDWGPALDGVDGVVHLAAIAHRFESSITSDRDLYDRVNHLATRSLAEAVARSGSVRRFLFVSSVRVHGDPEQMPVREGAPFAPVTHYDQSKVDAEAAVAAVLAGTQVVWAIIRPVLVYGPGNRGNMAKLEGLLRRGIPVPLPKKPNARSFVFVGNLASAIQAFITGLNPPSGCRWIVSDGAPASTETLLRLMGESMGLKFRGLHLPDPVLAGTARIGDLLRAIRIPFPWNTETRRKLHGDFYADVQAIGSELGWTPPYTLEEAMRRTYAGGAGSL